MSYSSEVLADSPVAYYRLGDASGSTMVDSSGNGHDGTYVNAPTLGATGLLTGDSDTAVQFNGSDEGAYGPIGAYANFTTFTIEAIIKPDVVSGTRVIACRQSGGNLVWTLRLEGTALKFYHWNAGGSLQGPVTSSATFAAGTTYHVAFTFVMSTSYAFYVNGAVAGSGTPSSTLRSNDIGLQVGASSVASGIAELFDGVIDEVAYYNASLSSTRIDAHYDAMSGPAPISGTLAAALPALTASLSGGYTPPTQTGTLAAVLPVLAASLSGGYQAPPVGALDAILPALTASLSGTYDPPPVPIGTLDAILPSLVAELTGGYVPPTQTGVLDAILPALTVSLTGDYDPLSNDGVLAAILPTLTVSLFGEYGGPYPTDTSNLFNGLSMVCRGDVTLARADVVPPTAPPKSDKALPYPEPVMVDGRPT